MNMLNILEITKTFVNDVNVLQKLNLEIKSGEFFSLLGPSGCGKTTLLRLIAGLETANSGQILFNNEKVDHLPARERPFHMVFQRYALFPHLNIYENLAFGLRLKKISENEIKIRVQETLDLVSLAGFENRWPETLSGGQQQRVALARALINRPKILLLDEPLSALDMKLREKMQAELKTLQQKTGITFIFVTHDQGEALALSDRIAVMNKGRIEQVGTPQEIYENPASLFVADFVGESSMIQENGGVRVIRPQNLKCSEASSRDDLSYTGKVIQTLFRGTEIELVIELQNQQTLRFFSSFNDLEMKKIKIGDSISVVTKKTESPWFKETAK